jgi:hypothetical protein
VTKRVMDGIVEMHMGHVLGGNCAGGEACGHTVGQVTARPHERVAAALFAALGTGMLTEDNLLGRLGLRVAEHLPKGASGALPGGSYSAGRGASTMVGLTGVLGVADGLTLSGWATRESDSGEASWAATVASPADADGRAWGSTVASSKGGMQWEAFVRMPAGEGVTVTPGVVWNDTGESRTMALAVRTSFTF